jgi:hypothetical protein
MRNFIVLFSTVLSLAAWADDRQDQRNVYEVLLETPKIYGVSTEEEVTARIKRHMANLLYPVDLSSFARPEKDARFRDLVRGLQKQMGELATGILTSGQFNRLAEAARDIGRLVLALVPQLVAVTAGENPSGRAQESDPTATVAAVAPRLTAKPGSPPAKRARCPRDRDTLTYP